MIDRHSKSAMHREAIEKEMLTSATSSTALSFSSGYIPATAFLSPISVLIISLRVIGGCLYSRRMLATEDSNIGH